MKVVLMKRVLLGVALSVGLAVGVIADGPSSEALLKARVVQLEAQLAQAQRQIYILSAQLSEAQQPTLQRQQAEQRAEVEKLVGCPIDWNTIIDPKIPPICKPEPKEEGKK